MYCIDCHCTKKSNILKMYVETSAIILYRKYYITLYYLKPISFLLGIFLILFSALVSTGSITMYNDDQISPAWLYKVGKMKVNYIE